MSRLSSLLVPVFTTVASIISGVLPMSGAPDNTTGSNSLKAAYYRQKYLDPHIDDTRKTAYLDSLIALRPSDIVGLPEKKIELSYEKGRYSDVIIACNSLRNDRNEALERNRKTTPDLLKLASVNESMEQINAICRDKDSTPQMKLDSIRHQIDNVAMLDNSWEVFRHNFEGVHSGFFRRLKEKHPDISDSEMRMCAYVAMHLSSKDIAALTSRTVRSVESMRYRIQKKTGISGKDSLADYLLSLTAAD